MSKRTRRATIDRLSKSGNPIANEEIDGVPIIVPGAREGETVNIELEECNGFVSGKIISPTAAQRKREWRAKLSPSNPRALRNIGRTVRKSKPQKRKQKTKASKSLQDLGKRYGGVSVEKQNSENEEKRSRTGRGTVSGQAARKQKKEIAFRYD